MLLFFQESRCRADTVWDGVQQEWHAPCSTSPVSRMVRSPIHPLTPGYNSNDINNNNNNKNDNNIDNDNNNNLYLKRVTQSNGKDLLWGHLAWLQVGQGPQISWSGPWMLLKNNLGINHDLKKIIEGELWVGFFDQHFSFKYFLKILTVTGLSAE